MIVFFMLSWEPCGPHLPYLLSEVWCLDTLFPINKFLGGRGCYRASFIFIVYSKRLGYKLIFFFLKEVKNFISGGEASVSLWYFFSFGYKL